MSMYLEFVVPGPPMQIEQRLNQVADGYRAKGYKVLVQPGPNDLPDFAKNFKVEILARRDDGCVLASAKKNRTELAADLELPRYAEIIGNHSGWRFDLFILGSDDQYMVDQIEGQEPTDEDLRRALEDVERMLQANFVQQSLLAAWAALEAAMRRRLHEIGERAGRGSSSRTMLNELYSSGVFQHDVFRDLEGLFQANNAIVHGFTIPVIEKSAVQFLVATVRMLLDESRAAKKIA